MDTNHERRTAAILTAMGDLATELVVTSSAAETAAWNEDVGGLREASERLASLHREYGERYRALLVADQNAPRGADSCSQ